MSQRLNVQLLCQVPPQCPNGVAGTYRAKEIATTAKELFTGKGATGDTVDPLLYRQLVEGKVSGRVAFVLLNMEEAIRFVEDSSINPPCTFLTDNETLVRDGIIQVLRFDVWLAYCVVV